MKKLLSLMLAVSCTFAFAQSPAPSTTRQRLRGTLQSLDGSTRVLAERSCITMTRTPADGFVVSEVVAIEPSEIKPGSYIGTAASPAADGTPSAIEALVFPEAARGTGEGHSAGTCSRTAR